MAAFPIPTSLRAQFPDLRPTPTIPTIPSTILALNHIYQPHQPTKNRLPHPPFQEHPNLEAETNEACPATIRAIWALPEPVVEGEDAPAGGLSPAGSLAPRRTLSEFTGGEWEMAEAEMWYTGVRGADEAAGTASPAARDVSVEALGILSLAAEQQQQCARAREEDGITAQLLARRLGNPARPTSAPAQPTIQRPPSPAPRPPAEAPPRLETARAAPSTSTAGRGRSRREWRVALGRALVSVRDRVDSGRWLEGVERIRENGKNVGAFYGILSLELQARTGVRDV